MTSTTDESSSVANIFSFPLALTPTSPARTTTTTSSCDSKDLLCVSLHKHVAKPQELYHQLYTHSKSSSNDDNKTHLALMDASRIVSPLQLVCAANMAVRRQKRPAWDTVFLAAPSTHAGHVWRDYAFGGGGGGGGEEKTANSQPQQQQDQDATIVLLSVGTTPSQHYQLVQQQCSSSLGEPQPMTEYFARSDLPVASFRKWYKLSQDEINNSSLEQAVLTKIATKMYL